MSPILTQAERAARSKGSVQLVPLRKPKQPSVMGLRVGREKEKDKTDGKDKGLVGHMKVLEMIL